MVNYANGKMYKLISVIEPDVVLYVGSTCSSRPQRKREHKTKAINNAPQSVYQHLHKIGANNFDLVVIEEYPCETKTQLLERERYWIMQLKPILNTHRPIVSYEEDRERSRKVWIQWRANQGKEPMVCEC